MSILKIYLRIFNKYRIMSTKAIKRIINKDIKEINKLNLNEQGIYINFDEENMLHANAIIIGPKDTPYENGVLFFRIKFPNDYPSSPPKVSYKGQVNIGYSLIYM